MSQLAKRIVERLIGMRRGLFLSPWPGHFYSPIVDRADMRRRADELFTIRGQPIAGVDLNESVQLAFLSTLESVYADIPFRATRTPGHRYYYENKFYEYSDAIFLYGIIKQFRPRRIIEIGSGFSSAVMLDTLDSLNETGVALTFIEPYADRLRSLMTQADTQRCRLLETGVQAVDAAVFAELVANDILFVDSTHVSKTGSDVNRIVFDILPALASGVLIHFHDIFYPLEYPRDWVINSKGFGWNEAYLLRAFLMYNPHFEIVAFNTFLEHQYPERFRRTMPDCLKNPGGSIWLRKK